MKNTIYFYNENSFIDKEEYLFVSKIDNHIFLNYINKLNPKENIKVRVSSYKNIVKILKIIGYRVIK